MRWNGDRMATVDEVAELLAVASATYPNFKMQVGPAQFAAAWHRHVGHLPAGQLQAAMDRAVASSEFFPTVADVLKAARQVEQGAPLTALEAWAKVKWAMRVYGNYHPPVGLPQPLQVNSRPWTFSDEKITRAIEGIGWEHLFDGDEDTMRAHFSRSYDAQVLRAMQPALPEPANVKALTP
jgi:hypothetical protein